MSSQEENRGGYFIDVESSAELARLLGQDRLLTRGMEGVLPELSEQERSRLQAVLDLACGPGGWVLDLARDYPEKQVYGVDISHLMIEYATVLAHSQQLNNAHFLQMDVTLPMRFPDASFDLINVRYLSGFLAASRWPELFQECKRLLRPGGLFRITESEMAGVSTSPALERMTTWLIEALWKSSQSFSPSGRRMATIAVVESHFRRGGYTFEGSRTHLINYSSGSPFHQGMCEDWRVAYKLTQPFFVKMGVATQEEIEQVYTQMLDELLLPDFCAVYDLHTFWGRKPL